MYETSSYDGQKMAKYTWSMFLYKPGLYKSLAQVCEFHISGKSFYFILTFTLKTLVFSARRGTP